RDRVGGVLVGAGGDERGVETGVAQGRDVVVHRDVLADPLDGAPMGARVGVGDRDDLRGGVEVDGGAGDDAAVAVAHEAEAQRAHALVGGGDGRARMAGHARPRYGTQAVAARSQDVGAGTLASAACCANLVRTLPHEPAVRQPMKGTGRTMAVTLADVARAVGVSASTVSRALSGTEKVNEATRQRIVKAAAEMG